MCYQLVYLIFDFPSDTTLKDAAVVGRCLSQLVESGLYMADEGVDNSESAWTAALRKGQHSVWVNLVNADHYALTLSVITNNWRRLYLSGDRSASAKPDAIQSLLKAGEIIYVALKPDYGYGLVSLDTQLLDPPGDGDYSITTIYDYNFYSPRLVKKIGEAKVKTPLTGRHVTFPDGGVLLEVSPNPLGDRNPLVTGHYQEIAQWLGVEKYQQGC